MTTAETAHPLQGQKKSLSDILKHFVTEAVERFPDLKGRFPYLILTMSVFAAYSNVYHNAFVWDDFHLIVDNDSLRHWSGLPDLLGRTTVGHYYRPIQALLYLFIYQIFGLSQAAFHGENVLLQAINTCLVYRLGCRLGFYQRASFAAALLWGIHPLWIEVVAMVAGTGDLLMGFFCMTGLLVLLPDFTPRRSGAEQIPGAFAPRKFWLASLCLALALGSKESAVVFPALASFSLFLISNKRLHPSTYLRTWPLWLLVAAYIIGWLMLANLETFPYLDTFYIEDYVINRALTSLATLPVYLSLIMTPADLHLIWDFPIFTTVWNWQVIAGAAMVSAALLQIFRGRGRRGLPLTWALLWFAAAFSPYSGILHPIDGQVSEHWMYMPTVGLFLGLSQTAAAWMDASRYKKLPVIAAGLVVLAALTLGIKTHLQNEILHDPDSLYKSVLKDNPKSLWAHLQQGAFYVEAGEFDKAIDIYQHEIDHSYGLPKISRADIHWKLAMTWLHLPLDRRSNIFVLDVRTLQSCQHVSEVIGELGKVLQDNPDYYWAHEALAFIYRYQGNSQMADFHDRQVRDILQKQVSPNP